MTTTSVTALAAEGHAGILKINTAAGLVPAADHVDLFARFQMNYFKKAVEVSIEVVPSAYEHEWRRKIAERVAFLTAREELN